MVTAYDAAPPRYKSALAGEGIPDQRTADRLTAEEAAPKIRAVKNKVGDGNARRHPLGENADSGRDHRNDQVRNALRYALKLFYAGSLANSINSREDARVGMRLADRFVSQLEISFALDVLANDYPSLHVILTLRFERRWERKRVAGQLGIGRDTVSKREEEALDSLIETIWR